MVFAALHRIYAGFINPPQAKKQDDAIRFGLLGASNIAPIALIKPAQAHPEVIIAAVAARDRSRAEAFAKKHGIPIAHKSYEGTICNVTELRSSV
jgi:argininosuccinate synthase